MATKLLLSIIIAITLTNSQLAKGQRDEFLYDTFPEDFKWGFASSAYQIEGGWDADGKGLSNWDEFTNRKPSPIKDERNGDIACDSYKKYKEDVQLLKSAGAHFYRFSISWPRVLPDGTIGTINEEGIQYYNDLINELLANDIEPMITLYHWDLPQALEEQSGWRNDTIIPHFKEYARLVYSRFGDRVKSFITFNEPWVFCLLGYSEGFNAPGQVPEGREKGAYLCGHNVLKSHAEAYHLYVNEFKPTQMGICGVTLDSSWYEPLNPEDPEHVEAAERSIQFKHGWFGSPLVFGDYPVVMREYIDKKLDTEGNTRLPIFTAEQSEAIKGSFDFLGLNHYTTELIAPGTFTDEQGWYADQETISSRDPTWERAQSDWLYVVPWGLRKLLVWLKNTYNDPLIFVTENGFSDPEGVGIHDDRRINYYQKYINEMLKAVTIDEVNVKLYAAWSILDNFEWANGYTERFGVHWVNFTDPERPRYPKDSVNVLKNIFQDNGFPESTRTTTSPEITTTSEIITTPEITTTTTVVETTTDNSGNVHILNSILVVITLTMSIIFLNKL